jgi:hypothetical protein
MKVLILAAFVEATNYSQRFLESISIASGTVEREKEGANG